MSSLNRSLVRLLRFTLTSDSSETVRNVVVFGILSRCWMHYFPQKVVERIPVLRVLGTCPILRLLYVELCGWLIWKNSEALCFRWIEDTLSRC